MPTGTIDAKYISSIAYLDQREILNKALDVTNEEESFLDVMELMGKKKVTATYNYHNFVNQELYAVETINGTPTDNSAGSAGTDFSIVVDAVSGASTLVPGALVICANKAVGRVLSKTADAGGDQIRIISVDGTDLALADNQSLSVFSNAQGEGSGSPDPIRYGLTKRQNQIQIFKQATKLTDIELGNKIEVEFEGKPYYMMKAQHDALMKFRGDISHALIFGKSSTTTFGDASPALVDGSGNAVQTTKGLNQYIETSGINLTGVTVNLAHYATLTRELRKRRCPSNYWLFVGSEQSIAHDDFLNGESAASDFTGSGRFDMTGEAKNFNVRKFSLYDITFAKKYLPTLDHQNVINFTGSAGFEKRCFYVPEGKIKAHGTGGMLDRCQIRYMEAPSNSPHLYYNEINTGGLAPRPTSDESVWKITYEGRLGLEVLGEDHFAAATLS